MADKKKIIVVSTDFGTEQDEIVVPVEKLRELGHDVTVATPTGKDVQTMKDDKDLGKVFPTDIKLADAEGPYDVVVLPGGTLNADAGRMETGIQQLVTKQAKAGRTIAAICHAPWILVETGLAKGKDMTSYESIATDVKNAGATFHDQAVVVCDKEGFTLITSRNPNDLDAFVEAIDAA